MPYKDIEACLSFVSSNRLIAERFLAKAKELLHMVQTVDDLDERIRIADLMQFSEARAAAHASIASLQERDLGVTCHCQTIVRPPDEEAQSTSATDILAVIGRDPLPS